MKIRIAYTVDKVTVWADKQILFDIACALEQRVYMEETGLTTDLHTDTLAVIHKVIEIDCDIEYIDSYTNKLTYLDYYCFS